MSQNFEHCKYKLTTTNHCKNTPTIIPSHRPPSSTYPNIQEPPESLQTIQKITITTTGHQRFKKPLPTIKKQPPTTQKFISKRQKHPENQIKKLKRKPTNKESNLKIQQPSKSNGGKIETTTSKIRTATSKIRAATKNPICHSAVKSKWIL